MNIISKTVRIINETAELNNSKVFKFMYIDRLGNKSLLTVTNNDVKLTLPDSRMPAALSNIGHRLTNEDYIRYGYPAGGYQAAKAIITKVIRDAYHKDVGDGQTVLSALKAITKINEWKLV